MEPENNTYEDQQGMLDPHRAEEQGDPMVDWIGTHEPDDTHFVPPQRAAGESVAAYLGRLDDATQAVRRHRPHRP